MQLSVRRLASVTILDLAGRLTLDDELGRLKEKVASLILTGHRNIIFNVSELIYVDSSGLGELVACHAAAQRAGASLKLAGVGRRLQDLLVITKLLTVFDAYDTEEAALESFAVIA